MSSSLAGGIIASKSLRVQYKFRKKKEKEMKVNGKYRILQASYWMMISVCFGYVTFYLSGFGYSAAEIGAITASFGIAAACCQPILGRIADKSRRFGWKTLILLLAAVCTADLVALTFSRSKLAVGVLFGAMMLLINCMMPLINAACFYYEKKSLEIDFGIARGLGSLSYAVLSLVLGGLTVRLGTSAVPLSGIPVILVLILTVISMPYGEHTEEGQGRQHKGKDLQNVKKCGKYRKIKGNPEKKNEAERPEKAIEKEKRSGVSFLKKYPAFSVMIGASVLLLSVHNFTSTYLLQMLERVGGNSGHLGTALAIAAVTEVPVMFLFSRIVKKVPSSVLLVVSGAAYTVKSLMLLASGNVGMIYAAQLLQPFSYALYAPAAVYFANECMGEEDKVTGQALMSMTSPAGTVIGNLVGGCLIDVSGVPAMLTVSSLTAVAAAAVAALAAVLHGKHRTVR